MLLKFTICTFVFLFFAPFNSINAQVVINEFLANPSGSQSEPDEFIELYNTDDGDVDISLWSIDDIDGGGSSPYEIAEGTIMEGKSFLYFERGSSGVMLNNSGDSVRLLDNTNVIIDQHSYTSTIEDVSVGRSNDGGGEFVICSTVTKGESNKCAVPTSTLTPSSTPIEPTNTIEPTESEESGDSPTGTQLSQPRNITNIVNTPTMLYKTTTYIENSSGISSDVSSSGSILGVFMMDNDNKASRGGNRLFSLQSENSISSVKKLLKNIAILLSSVAIILALSSVVVLYISTKSKRFKS